jgi:hypothetical protein
MRVSFGCNRCRTREKTQTSKEKAPKKDPEKEGSPVTRIDRHCGKNPEVKIQQAFSQVLSNVRLN